MKNNFHRSPASAHLHKAQLLTAITGAGARRAAARHFAAAIMIQCKLLDRQAQEVVRHVAHACRTLANACRFTDVLLTQIARSNNTQDVLVRMAAINVS